MSTVMTPPQPFMVGEAVTHVQGFGLKVIAAVSWRSTNSPVTRGIISGGRFLWNHIGSCKMEDYKFWQDFFDTYQSLSDWMKFAWLIVPPIFLLGLIALIMRYRLASKRANRTIDGELIYSIHRGADDQLQVFQHGEQLTHDPKLIFLEDRQPFPKDHLCWQV